MAKQFDRIIVIDLEATCWEDSPQGLAEKGDQISEIIEIGVCNYWVQSGKITHPLSILVRPTTSKISEFCTKLTGHTWDRIRKEGIPFSGAINRLRKLYGPKQRILASWGNYDRWMVSEQCLREDVDYPFGASHINVKELHGISRKLKKALGLGAAITHENLSFEGRPHSGVDDAYNTAVILSKLL